MSNPGTTTSAPTIIVNATGRPGNPMSSIISSSIAGNSTPAVAIPTPTLFSITTTSDFLTSPMSPSYISSDDLTVTPASSSAVGGITVTVVVVETAVLSSDTPQHTGFAHQTGVITGMAIGGTFLLILIIVLLFFACRSESNSSYDSSMEDIFTVSRLGNASWRPPLEAEDDDYVARYRHSVSHRSFGSQGHDDARLFSDHLSGEGSGSVESADAYGASLMKPVVGGQPIFPPVAHTLQNSRDLSDQGHDPSRPRWAPLYINKRNSPQAHFSANSSALGGHSSSRSSGEVPLLSITEPRSIHKPSGISQIILARLRRPRTATIRFESAGLSPPYDVNRHHRRHPAPSVDTSSMVEGLLHPRLSMAYPQQASSTSLRDHEDYTRPINGLVNNHMQSTDTLNLGEGGGTT